VNKLYSEPVTRQYDTIEFRDGRFFERFSQPQIINGKTVGRVWSFRDITRNKKAEAQIIAARDKAEESDRLKTAFLHNISHEIRTPMNAIIGFSTLLNEKGLNEHERRQYTEFIFSSARQLLSIINDIVDIANIESGKIRLTLKRINVNSTLKMIYEQFSIRERSPGVRLEMKLSLSDSEADIISDETKLIQVITNLLSNAIKFTGKGSIEFGYTRKESVLEFFVNDTGIGIPEDHQERIFDRFYQVDDAATRQYGGTGLGLSICKSYVGLLGGEIHLKSKPGEGSSFTFTIPYNQNTGTL
jgi:signal transduction histidine kinase